MGILLALIVIGSIVSPNSSLLAQTQPTVAMQKVYTLSGHVVDADSRETLIGATVYAPETQHGTYTNAYGFFSLSSKHAITKLRISYIGYETQTITLDPRHTGSLTIQLKPQTQLREVVVTEERKQLHAPQPGAIAVPVHIIKQTPALLGENDLMKALQLMPGVQSGSEGSAGVHVRGGGADENLILLDGVSLYNVDHLLGFFSVFTPEAVKKVDLYKGNFPARFGGRLSSVIDVRTNDGNMQKYKGALTIGLLSSKVQFEGPIIKDRTSFNISARRTYADLIVKPFLPEDFSGGYYFYDINTKLQHRFSDKDRIYLSLYHGRDRMHSSSEESSTMHEQGVDKRVDATFSGDLYWGNTLAALRWNHVFSPKLYSDLTLSYTRYIFTTGIENSLRHAGQEVQYNALRYRSGIEDLSASWNAHYYLSPSTDLRFGLDYIYHTFSPESFNAKARGGLAQELGSLDNILGRNKRIIPAHHAALYAEAKTKLLPSLELNAGARATLFAVDSKSYLSIQPRLALDWRILPDLNTTLGYTRMVQNVHLLSSAAMTLPTDLWVPATKNISPMNSSQISLSTNYRFGGWQLSLEGYYKDMNNVLEYKDGTSFVGSSEGWEDKVEMGQGRSYGLETILMRQIGQTTGWVGYNLSKTERRFPDGTINQGQWFPYKYDRRHKFNIVVTHKFGRRLELSAAWEYFSGGVITLAYERMDYLHLDDEYSYGSQFGNYSDLYIHKPYASAGYVPERNNFRLPATHRLNLSANFNRFHKNGARSIWNISVFNAYNAKNPAYVIPRRMGYRQDGVKAKVTQFTLLPLIPSFSYTYKF